MNDQDRVSDLTIGQLKQLIFHTVQEAVAEVLLEFSIAAEHDAALYYQAEMTDWLRASIQERFQGESFPYESDPVFDD